MIPGESQDEVQRALEEVLQDPEIKISVMTAAIPSPDSVPAPAILRAVKRVTQSMWPGGIPAYGIDGFSYRLMKELSAR